MDELSKQLIPASEEGKLQELQRLLDNKANVNYQNRFMRTGLMRASFCGHLECVRVLLEKKADVHGADHFGDTALMSASTSGHVDCMKLLLESNASVDNPNRCGRTALFSACKGGKLEGAKLLLEYNANVNHRSRYGHTAMTACICSVERRLGCLLMCCGADKVSTMDNNGNRADVELFAELQTRITLYHTELKKVLSKKVIVDTRLYLEEHGLYHEPLERVMQYCGLELMLENDPNREEDDPIPILLRGRKQRANSALYYLNLLLLSVDA